MCAYQSKICPNNTWTGESYKKYNKSNSTIVF